MNRIGPECTFPVGPAVCPSAGPVPDQPEFVPAEPPSRTPRKSRAARPSHDRLAWSDPVPRSERRSRHPDVSVPEVWPADLSLIGPSDPGATPALHPSTTSMSRRHAATGSFSRASRFAAPDLTNLQSDHPTTAFGILAHGPVLIGRVCGSFLAICAYKLAP